MTNNYIEIFSKLENGVRKQSGLTEDLFAKNFSKFKNIAFRDRSDQEYFQILKEIVFHSGFKAKIVNNKLNIINKHLPDYERIAGLSIARIEKIMSDSQMIRNRRKIDGIIKNAKSFKEIIARYATFQRYLESTGVCLTKNPKCSLCELQQKCNFYQNH